MSAPKHWRTDEREQRLREVLDKRQPGLTVVLENIHDPHNVSAIFRSADAVGVHEMHLLYHIDEFPNLSRWGKKSSAGTRKWIERHKHETVEGCFAALRTQGFRILVSSFSPASRPIQEIDLTGNIALMFSNEHRGVAPECVAQADGEFIVPMVGMTKSLNVSVAAAVSLYEAFRQRRDAGLYNTPQLSAEERERLLEIWLRR